MVIVGFTDCEYSFVAAHLFPIHDGAFLCLVPCINSTQHVVNESSELLSTFLTSAGEAEVLYPVLHVDCAVQGISACPFYCSECFL